MGERVYRESLFREGQIDVAALVMEKRMPLGARYLTCPRGPIVRAGGDTKEVAAFMRAVGTRAGALFFRFEPPVEGAPPLQDPSLTRSIDIHPADTLLSDMTLSEEVLLEGMHQKTRYNIRLAERKGVEVEIDSVREMDVVWEVFEKTAGRGGFHLHPKAYYQKMLDTLSKDSCKAFLAVARFEGELIAANMMIDFAGTRTYLHGASDHAKRTLMAPYLLHWELMKDAKQKGVVSYDWWGVAPEGVEKHAWAGITRFKEGFGGERISYPGTYDLLLRPGAYKAYTFARTLFRKIRSSSS